MYPGCALAWVLLAPLAPAGDDPAAAALPEGFGLSEKYPGDRGIAADPSVLLAEDFEAGDLAAVLARWDEANNTDGKPIALAAGGPEGTGGTRALQVTATAGQDHGGSLYRRLARGADRVFARFYVKFAPDADYIHHFVHLGGHRPPTRWPDPRAGTCPKGDDRFSVGIEPWGERGAVPAPGNWGFYAYWHEMKVSARGEFWGNGLKPIEPQPAPRDRWQCVEVMIALNTVGQRDGELALWLDGKPVAHIKQGVRRDTWTGMGFRLLREGGEPFEGFSWRTTTELQVNWFWLLHYVTENAAKQNNVAKTNPVNRVWFDDVVVSERYIGPIKPAPPPDQR